MKKCLLTIAAGLLIGFGASAQYDATTIWQVEDATTKVYSLTGLTKTNGFDTETSGPTVSTGYGGTYTYTWETNDIIRIDFTNKLTPNQWSDFGFTVVQWDGTTNNKFTKTTAGEDQDHDKARGWTVDFSDEANRLVTMKVQASANINLRADLTDIAGKTSNGASPKVDVVATTGGVNINDAAKWATIKYSWGGASVDAGAAAVEIMEDWYSGTWWGVDNTDLKDAQNPLDAARIVKLGLTFDDGGQGTLNDAKTLYIKDIVIGKAANPQVYAPWASLETVSGAALQVVDGVIYSAGAIKVTNAAGQVVKVAKKTLEISSLPAGVLVITAAEGTAKIVK